ncbi:MAG: transaldolase [Dokdonella sp.]
MSTLHELHQLGQSLWLDNIARDILDDGTLRKYVDEFEITGLTSNPSIFDKAISDSEAYDDAIAEKAKSGKSAEDMFMELALDDLRRAAKLFEPAFKRSKKLDGWVSMEVSPLLAADTKGSIEAARKIHEQAATENLLVKIPGTLEGIPAIEESIFNGIPINVTLLFSAEQYLAAAHAYLRGIERRIEAGLDPVVGSVASLFVSRWDKGSADDLPEDLHNTLGIAMSQRAYRNYRELLASPRWKKLADVGAQPQRLLWASTSAKDPKARDTLYVEALAAPDTVNTIPEKTLKAFADHGKVGKVMADDGGDCEAMLKKISDAGVDIDALAKRLQKEGAESFVESWNHLLKGVADKAKKLGGK